MPRRRMPSQTTLRKRSKMLMLRRARGLRMQRKILRMLRMLRRRVLLWKLRTQRRRRG